MFLSFLQQGRLPFLYGYVVLFGLGYGAAPVLLAARAADLFQGRQFGVIFGSLSMALGLGGAAGAWVTGKLFDISGGYASALFLAALSLGLAAILFRRSYRFSIVKEIL